MAGKIFINYRRDDSIGTAGRLHDRLAQTFGRKNLFMDVDHVPAGVDFVDYLNGQVAACDVFLAVIGPNWLNAKDERGRRRFDNPNDYVTIEIAAALARKIRVIPVLVDGARMPNPDKLPDSVKPFVRRNAVEIRNTQFGRDAEALSEKVREALSGKPVRIGRWRAAAGVVVALLFLGWIGLFATGMPISLPWAVQPDTRTQAEKERLVATAEAEAKRKATEAEQQRLAAAKAEEERKAKATEAEAKRKADEAEQQRLAAVQGRGWLGATLQQVTDQIAESLMISPPRGALVVGVDDNGPAKSSGIELRDVIVRFDGKDIKEMPELPRVVADTPVGKQVPVVIIRKGKEETKTVTLGERTGAFALVDQGIIDIDNRDYDGAIVALSEAIRLDPKRVDAFANRGAAYANKGDYDRAIADYNEAIRLYPNVASTFNNRGIAYANKGDYDRAIADYNEAIRLDPKNVYAFCNRGRAKLKINDEAGSKADIAKARELDASICR
jgi:tetratricopeptide (TPR) repeat protein